MSPGKSLENKITKTNFKYLKKNLACIQFLDTPVTITNKGAFLTSSTVDFIGCVAPTGRGIAFDAKHTLNANSFPLSNIKDHQILFLDLWEKSGGLSYFIIQFSKNQGEDHAFLTPFSFIKEYWDKAKKENGKKSIKYELFNSSWKVELTDYLNLKKEE